MNYISKITWHFGPIAAILVRIGIFRDGQKWAPNFPGVFFFQLRPPLRVRIGFMKSKPIEFFVRETCYRESVQPIGCLVKVWKMKPSWSLRSGVVQPSGLLRSVPSGVARPGVANQSKSPRDLGKSRDFRKRDWNSGFIFRIWDLGFGFEIWFSLRNMPRKIGFSLYIWI